MRIREVSAKSEPFRRRDIYIASEVAGENLEPISRTMHERRIDRDGNVFVHHGQQVIASLLNSIARISGRVFNKAHRKRIETLIKPENRMARFIVDPRIIGTQGSNAWEPSNRIRHILIVPNIVNGLRGFVAHLIRRFNGQVKFLPALCTIV